jgi:G3E family GTPase
MRLIKLIDGEELKKNIFRSKGFIWLRHLNDIVVEWEQAGKLFSFMNDGRWYCTFTEEDWVDFDDEETKEEIIKTDFLDGS